MHLYSLLALLAPSLATAARLTITIQASPPLLPNPNSLPPTTHATLLGPHGVSLTARISRTNTLTFFTVSAGSHLLTLHTRDYTFPSYRVDVVAPPSSPSSSSQADDERIELVQTFRGHEWGNKGPLLGSGNGTLSVSVAPLARKEYYQQREGFNVLNILKSPMILIALFSAAMVFGMPYLLESMDPETRAEYEEAQKQVSTAPVTGAGEAANAIQNFDFASWMAGKTSSSGADTTTEPSARSIR